MAQQVVFDTDPGVDDALALLWLASLCHQGHCSLECVTTVEGNVRRELTYDNAGRLLKVAGLEQITVGTGSFYRGGRNTADHVHGEDGLGGLAELLPPPDVPFAEAPSSESLLSQHLDKSVSTSLLAVGPLTNLARVEQANPGTLNRAKEVIVMGGAVQQGNVTPYAEFNIHFDPDSANHVFHNTNDLILIPLNVTRKLVFTTAHARHAGGTGSGVLPQLLTQLTEFMTATAQARGVNEGFLVHDAATVAYLMHPELLSFAQAQLEVDLSDTDKNGETIADFGESDGSPRAWIATDVKAELLLEKMCDDLRWLSG